MAKYSEIKRTLEHDLGVSIEYKQEKKSEVDNLIEKLKFTLSKEKKIIKVDLNNIDSMEKFAKSLSEELNIKNMPLDFEEMGCEIYDEFDGEFILIVDNFGAENSKKIAINFTSKLRSWYDRGYLNLILLSTQKIDKEELKIGNFGSFLTNSFLHINLKNEEIEY